MVIDLAPAAARQWRKLPAGVQTRLKEKLVIYAEDPLMYATKLTNSSMGSYRFRIGDYRVIFELELEKIIVVAVGHRREIYR